MKLFRKTFFALASSMFVLAACNSGNADTPKTEKDTVLSSADDPKPVQNTDSLIAAYIQTLQTDSVKFVDSSVCEDYQKNITNYEKGILQYHLDGTDKLEGDINGDAKPDYVVNYKASNCWGGIGAGNYLSNFFFLISENGSLQVDENLTMKFKQQFLDAVTKEYPANVLKIAKKHEAANDIDFKKISDAKVSGEFMLIQCGAEPCVQGNFDYDFISGELKFTNIKKLESEFIPK